jgi:hypothetical protein
MCIRQADNDGNHSPEERTVAVSFLADLWIYFNDKISINREDMASQIVKVMKRSARDRYRPLRTTALAQMFRLLEIMSREKNQYAPIIYRALAMSLVENHGDSSTREYIMFNFKQIFLTQAAIPVGFVVEPLVNQIQISEGTSYIFNSIDFDFFIACARHPKLQSQQAIPLCDVLAKVYLNNQSYARCAGRPLLMLISRYLNERGMRDFVSNKFVPAALSSLLTVEKNQSPSKSIRKNTKGKDKGVNRTLKKANIIDMIR